MKLVKRTFRSKSEYLYFRFKVDIDPIIIIHDCQNQGSHLQISLKEDITILNGGLGQKNKGLLYYLLCCVDKLHFPFTANL